MARISTYSQDTTVNAHDQLIGTDGGMIGNDGRIISGTGGSTKNFLLSDLRDFFQNTQTDSPLTDGDVPYWRITTNPDGSSSAQFEDSLISQTIENGSEVICVGRFEGTTITETASLKVAGDVRLGGNLTNLNGDAIVSATGGYQTAAINGGVETLQPFTVTVITGAGIKILPPAPADGDWVKIVDLTASNMRVMLNAGGNRFKNDDRAMNNVLVLDSSATSFELVYVNKTSPGNDAPVGWVIVGAQTTN